MELTLSTRETAELLAVAVENIGLKDIDPATVEVSVKTLRDGSGGSQLTINCHKFSDQQHHPQPTATAQSEEFSESDDSDTGDDSGDSDSDSSDKTASIFGA